MYPHTLLLLIVSVLQSAILCATDIPTTPPRYTIDLDLPPEVRWEQIIADVPYAAKQLDAFIRAIIPEELIPLVETIASSLETYIQEPYAAEIRGIAAYSNTSIGGIVLMNIFYEISASCTSIVATDEQGNIWHARNMDYDFTDLIRNTTIVVDFMKHGKIIYNGVTFVGYVGLLTGQRPFAFTISLDQRDSYQRWKSVLVALLDRDLTVAAFAIRNALESCTDFQSAVSALSTQDTIASEYYIVGGITGSDGAVITKGRVKPIDTWYLQPSTGRWFLVETNYDHWAPPPPDDNRRDPAIKYMNATGRSLTKDKLFRVLSTPPLVRSMTVYTTVMSASQPSLMQTWVRHVN